MNTCLTVAIYILNFSDCYDIAELNWIKQIHVLFKLKCNKFIPLLFSGSVWTKNPATFEHFSIEVVFKVTGRGRVGADGLVSQILHALITYIMPPPPQPKKKLVSFGVCQILYVQLFPNYKVDFLLTFTYY